MCDDDACCFEMGEGFGRVGGWGVGGLFHGGWSVDCFGNIRFGLWVGWVLGVGCCCCCSCREGSCDPVYVVPKCYVTTDFPEKWPPIISIALSIELLASYIDQMKQTSSAMSQRFSNFCGFQYFGSRLRYANIMSGKIHTSPC